MIKQENTEHFLRSKILLQEKLAEIGKISGSSEIESQMMFVETRVQARVNQAILHGVEEMNALRYILIEAAKPDKEE